MTSANTKINYAELKKAIARTIVFFDIFDYPLSTYELWRCLNVACDFKELQNILPQLCRDEFIGKIETYNGFYFLAGRKEILKQRNNFYNLANQKHKIARRGAKILRFLPGVKMIAIGNNFYYHDTSDIDLFIVVASGRLWLLRSLITIVVHVLGIRRHGQKVANRLCLSFYVSEENENLANLTLVDDPYFYYWLSFLIPLYSEGKYYQHFWEANNWIMTKLPNSSELGLEYAWSVRDNLFFRGVRRILAGLIFSKFGAHLEKTFKKMQMRKMAHNVSSLAKEDDTRVIISDSVLKFHENDRRGQFLDKLNKKYEEIFGA
ncbi:MAG: hypothetical protein WCK37_05225 [Candidatus Falkowbacteria bacterium]